MDQYADFFRWLTGFSPYSYQRRVAAVLLGRSAALKAGLGDDVAALEGTLSTQLARDGANVVLQAPTGAGKTWAAVVPLIFSGKQGNLIADRLLYAAPLRTLAENLYESTKEKLRERNLQDRFPVRLQTGETTAVPGVGDPSFAEGRIIFCTIDQVLSSYLNIPFGLSARQANLNAGALVGSLLIFDEYHLLDPDRSLQTALLLARHLSGLTGIVWIFRVCPAHGHRGVPLEKGTETCGEDYGYPDGDCRHRGVPLEKGTETWMASQDGGIVCSSQRCPPREGD